MSKEDRRARVAEHTSTTSPASTSSGLSAAGAGEGATSTAGVASRSGATEAWRDGGAGVAAFEAGAGVGAGAASGAGVALGESAAAAAGVGERALGTAATSAGAMVMMVVVVKDEGEEGTGGRRLSRRAGAVAGRIRRLPADALFCQISTRPASVRATLCDGISHASVRCCSHFCSLSRNYAMSFATYVLPFLSWPFLA